MSIVQTRRSFLTGLSLAGAAGLVRVRSSLADEGALETTTVRIHKAPVICMAPQYLSEELLRAEGFADVRYVEVPVNTEGPSMGRGEADFSMSFVAEFIQDIDAGAPIVLVAGIHVGCFELFAQPNIHRIGELNGKRVAADDPALLRLMAGQVGLDPTNDLHWATGTDVAINPVELFAQGKIDAFLGFPPHPQEMRARGFDHTLVNTAMEPPLVAIFLLHAGGQPEIRP
jgi:NitT/TauT family transport system substrate-binding protein